MHERGMADHDLIDDSERDRFRDVTGTTDHDRTMTDDRRTMSDDDRTMTDDDRTDERRFERERITEDVRDSERTQR
jgi:hypothetical protein